MAEGATKQDVQNNNITLKGSAALVSEFFFYGINCILYQRGIYPPENFKYKQQYGLTLFITTEKDVLEYLNSILAQIKEWLEAGQVQRLVLAVRSVDTSEVLERWDFCIQTEKEFISCNHNTDGKYGQKDLKVIQQEMRDIMRQITACVTFLPLLDCQCSFELLVYTMNDCEVPEKWGNSGPCFITNSEEVRLKSFHTSVHKVEASVSYKVDF